MLSLSVTVPVAAQKIPGGAPELGPRFRAAPQLFKAPGDPAAQQGGTMGRLLYWNKVAIDASGLDHTLVSPDGNRTYGEQLGPVRSSRAMAIVHIAIFEAVNAIDRRYQSYTGLEPAPKATSMGVAIAQAAHDTLVELFPSQKASFDKRLAKDLQKRLPQGSRAMLNGIVLGQQAAAAILAFRDDYGASYDEPAVDDAHRHYKNGEPGMWRQDPVSRIPIAMGKDWNNVNPFVLKSANQFRVPPPPALNSPQYATAFNEVKRLGGDGITTPTQRTAEQTMIGTYWSYDGTPTLCAPTRLYNQITVHIAEQMGSNVVELARLLALTNVAQAEAGIASWESKYYYDFWRPVTGIREAGGGVTSADAGDGNPATVADPGFVPLGAPASNISGPNFTPPFPTYPSGHATFGGALFQTLRNFYKTDEIAFTFVSDEYNGVTQDNKGNVRPLIPRNFSSLSQAEQENGQSRIYLGVHWAFDSTSGIAQGRRIADYVFERAFVPRRRTPNAVTEVIQ